MREAIRRWKVRRATSVTGMILVAALLIAGYAPQVLPAAAQEDSPGTVTVTGDAEVRVVPDEVVLVLGVETWDKNLGKAKRERTTRSFNGSWRWPRAAASSRVTYRPSSCTSSPGIATVMRKWTSSGTSCARPSW